MDLVVVAIWSFAVALAGGVAGLVLGNLRLPVVLQFSSSAAAGAGAGWRSRSPSRSVCWGAWSG